MSGNSEKTETIVDSENIKCPGCGNNLKFDPLTKKLVCEYCMNQIAIDNISNAEELDFLSAASGNMQYDKKTKVFTCDNCGARVVLDEGETAAKCAFCGSSHVICLEDLNGIKPNALIPFKFDKYNASQVYKNWAKKKIFCPTEFKKKLKLDTINGTYAPCWTFDSNTFSTYNGRFGEHYTVTVGSGKNRHTVVKTRWYNVSGTYNKLFDDILIICGSDIPQKSFEKISPYSTNVSVKYDHRFLLGFSASHYKKDINESWAEAKKRMTDIIYKDIISNYHADVVDYLNVNTNHRGVRYKYVLLPVYVGAFNYKKKLYNIYVNGETGKVTGKLPKSPIRIAIAALLGVALFILLLLILGVFQ